MRIWKRNWIVITAIIVHGFWGIVLLFSPLPTHTTPLGLVHKLPILDRSYITGCVYLGATVVAVLPFLVPRWDELKVGIWCCLPQQGLLMVSFATAVISIALGRYPDGYVPDKHGNPHLFIMVDQLWPIVGMFCHTLSLWDWYWWSRLDLQDLVSR